MKKISVVVATFVVSGCALICPFNAIAASSDDVRAQYEGKQMMLRNFYCGKKLEFDAQGKLLSGQASGPWTVCRDIRIDEIKFGGKKLEIVGQRVYLFYDSQQKSFRDVTNVMDRKKERYKELVKNQKVSIHMDLPANHTDQDIQSSMGLIFYSSEEQFTEAAPDVWKPFLQHRDEKGNQSEKSKDSDQTNSSGRASFISDATGSHAAHVGNGVKAPVPVYTPDPNYAEEARQSLYQGTVVLTVIVGPDGLVHHVTISRPLGMGMDEKATEKLLSWKFRPATKDGKAVAVEVSVEVQFNLY